MCTGEQKYSIAVGVRCTSIVTPSVRYSRARRGRLLTVYSSHWQNTRQRGKQLIGIAHATLSRRITPNFKGKIVDIYSYFRKHLGKYGKVYEQIFIVYIFVLPLNVV